VYNKGMKDRILSGIRATGRLHVGNYLGALKQFVEIQNQGKYDCYFFIADLHALTTPFEPKELTQNTLEVAADYLAAGIDPEKSVFFLQNQVLEHTELGWIFNCLTPLGELNRMTQFKDKSQKHHTSVNGGLLTYPTLMAADILLYQPSLVPVGDDQKQHVELARDLARKFNNRFGETFPEPKLFYPKPIRIMSLTNPDKKMSKTRDEALMLDDAPEEILRKLKKAPTATDAKKKSSGVDNLFLLLKHFGTKKQYQKFEDQQKKNTIKYSELKTALAESIADHFADFRSKRKKFISDKKNLVQVITSGSKKARLVASKTLKEVKAKVGLI
jgi:tryptophanyl-tRNA synthetase